MNERETVTEKRIKAKKGMDCCKDMHIAGRWGSGCISCPYAHDGEKEKPCYIKLFDDVIELL